jgi:pimeloyl-ACP methyl ester carboxylesterase
MDDVQIRSVSCADGTTLGYRQLGRGPGLIVLHGAMSGGCHHLDLARALADRFTVLLPDRRAHGGGSFRPGPVAPQEVADLQALVTATGAREAFGVSAGALILLHAWPVLGGLERLALFEPPLVPDAARATAESGRVCRELDAGDLPAAMVSAMRYAEMGPKVIRALPRPLLERLTRSMIAAELRRGSAPYPAMTTLGPALRADLAVVADSAGPASRFAGVGAEVLLLGGSKSPGYLRRALVELEHALPRVRRVELPGVGHDAAWNRDRRGHPEPVAQQLRRCFFGELDAAQTPSEA